MWHIAQDAWISTGNETLLDRYTTDALHRVWQAPALLMVDDVDVAQASAPEPLPHRLPLAQLSNVVGSTAYATALAEDYVG